MTAHSFLDSGVLLAYCFTTDMHHLKCKSYLNGNDYQYYISERVEGEYEKKEYHLSTRYSDAILDHVSDLRKSKFDTDQQLGPMDVNEIQTNILSRSNPSFRFLSRFYSDHVPNFIQFSELEETLRGLARDVEAHAMNRKNELDQITAIWERESEYPDIGRALNAIHEQDRKICLDAHDLASNKPEPTEFATINPKDFLRDGRKDLILSTTALSSIVSLAVTS